MSNMYDKLNKEIQNAKTCAIPREQLHHVYGRITMAHELESISTDEFMRLNTACVRDGINNPQYFN